MGIAELFRTLMRRATATIKVIDTGAPAWAPPVGVIVELTSRCNLKCVYCPLTAETSSTAIVASYADVDRLLPQLGTAAAAGADQIVLAGFGEPSLHPRFVEALKSIDAMKILYSYSTNGIALPPRLAAALPNLDGLTTVNVSVDVGDAEEYARIRGGSLERVWNNICALSRLAGKFTVNVSAILTKSSVPHLPKLVSAASQNGAQSLTFQSLYDSLESGSSEHIYLDPALSGIIDAAEGEAVSLGLQVTTASPERRRLEHEDPDAAISTFFDDPRTRGLSRNCNVPWEWLYIDAKGRAFPCCNTAAVDDACVGELASEDLLDIWNGRKMQDFRTALSASASCPDVCARCAIAPAGFPSSSIFAAKIVGIPSFRNGEVEVRFRNTGQIEWVGDNRPRIGTAGPRDRLVKAAAGTGWLSDNRAAVMGEEIVRPGEIASFRFRLQDLAPGQVEKFELVVDGILWLPQTLFSIPPQPSTESNRARPIFAAAMVGMPSIRNGRAQVCFQNSGMATWEGRYRPSIATTFPRDRLSEAATPAWLSGNRAAKLGENPVAPGEIACFEFELGSLAANQVERFELVIDGVVWFSGTSFDIESKQTAPAALPAD